MAKNGVMKRIPKRGVMALGAAVGGALGEVIKDMVSLTIPHADIIENAAEAVAGFGIMLVEKDPGLLTGLGAGMIGNAGGGLKDALQGMMDAGKTGAKGTGEDGLRYMNISDPQNPALAMSDPQNPALAMSNPFSVSSPYGMSGMADSFSTANGNSL